jgi:hypothetical protein
MKRIILSTTLALAATPFAMHGADSLDKGADPLDNPNRFSFGPTFGLNFKADFHNNVNPGPTLPGGNHTYNDGYVLADDGTHTDGLTQNWNYQNASQYNAAHGGTMNFLNVGSSSVTGDPQYGGEFIYQRVIGSLPVLSGDWGLEAGFGFTELDLRENLGGTATVDSYSLNGVIPPGPGNGGISGAPQALLGDTPTRTAAGTGYQKLSGQMYSLRLGPFAEWNITHKFSLAASVGLTLAPTIVDYDFSETATLAGGTFMESGHSSKTELLYGPYVGAMLRYDFDKCWGVYVGARFQNLTDLSQSIGSRTARLDAGATVNLTAGASWRF